MSDLHVPRHPVRLVTASALFDGHDASINIMRRIFQSQGAEVVHLGHNRSVAEVVDAAIEEDVQGVAVSSYQGGHVEYFEYLVESLRAQGAGHVQVVGGGGGVIVPEEIARLRSSGVTIFSPEDGQRMGLAGMINSVVEACDTDLTALAPLDLDAVLAGERAAVARAILANKGYAVRNTFLDGARTQHRTRSLPAAWSDGGDTEATGAGRRRLLIEYTWALGAGLEDLSVNSSDDAAAVHARASEALGGSPVLNRRGVCLPRTGRLSDLLPWLATVILQAR